MSKKSQAWRKEVYGIKWREKKPVVCTYTTMIYTEPEPKVRPETERAIFAMCKGERTRKKAKNSFSREQAGSVPSIIVTKRFANSRLTCVCKSRKY